MVGGGAVGATLQKQDRREQIQRRPGRSVYLRRTVAWVLSRATHSQSTHSMNGDWVVRESIGIDGVV